MFPMPAFMYPATATYGPAVWTSGVRGGDSATYPNTFNLPCRFQTNPTLARRDDDGRVMAVGDRAVFFPADPGVNVSGGIVTTDDIFVINGERLSAKGQAEPTDGGYGVVEFRVLMGVVE